MHEGRCSSVLAQHRSPVVGHIRQTKASGIKTPCLAKYSVSSPSQWAVCGGRGHNLNGNVHTKAALLLRLPYDVRGSDLERDKC